MSQTSSRLKGLLGILLGLAIILCGVLIYNYKGTRTAPTPPPSTSNHYKSTTQGFEFDYPKDLFVLSEKQSMVDLKSRFYITENSRGFLDRPDSPVAGSPPIPDRSNYYFAINFEMRNTNLEDAMDADNPSFSPTYQQLKGGQTVDKSFLDTMSVNGKTGYIFTYGAEGINMKNVYVAKDTKKTLVIKLSYIGETMVPNMKPSQFSEKQQLDTFNTILATLKFN